MSTKSLHWVVDAIEEGSAAIEVDGGAVIHLPCGLLPADAKPGDVLRVSIEIDAAATKRAVADSAAQIKKGMDASRKRDPGGDIQL